MGNKNAWVELYLGEIISEAAMWKEGYRTGKEFITATEKILEKLVSKDKSIIVEERLDK